MICVVGDIHGEFFVLEHILSNLPPEVIVIQVGDFGIWPILAPSWPKLPKPIYFIDGNHDHIPSLPIHGSKPVEIWPGAIYVPRGIVLELDGKRVMFLGGSKSVDRARRTKDSEKHGWFESEQIDIVDELRAMAGGPVDLMITHAPPDFVIRNNFSPDGLRYFGHDPLEWIDESARAIERVWKALDRPRLICGHMHRSLVDGNVQILGINETVMV